MSSGSFPTGSESTEGYLAGLELTRVYVCVFLKIPRITISIKTKCMVPCLLHETQAESLNIESQLWRARIRPEAPQGGRNQK